MAEINWIIETKERVWEETQAKDATMSDWCEKDSHQTGILWLYLRVNQDQFGDGQFPSFADLIPIVRGCELPI